MAARDQENPFDKARRVLKSTYEESRDRNRAWARSMRPYNSVEPTREERLLIWNNPHLRFPDALDEATQMPLTNAQAAQKWANDDPGDYIAWAEEVDRLERRYAREAADEDMGEDMGDLAEPVDSAEPMEVSTDPYA